MDKEEYIDIQRKINTFHVNGAMEHFSEEATSWANWLAQWIRNNNMPHESFLDAGCRTGYVLEALAEEFPAADITGVDIVPEFVEIANQREDAVQGDIQNLPFDDKAFDWVFSGATIEHAPDPQAAADELKRVARVGVYICTDLEHVEAFERNPSHFVRHEDPLEWCEYFKDDKWKLTHLYIPHPQQLHMLWLRNTSFVSRKVR